MGTTTRRGRAPSWRRLESPSARMTRRCATRVLSGTKPWTATPRCIGFRSRHLQATRGAHGDRATRRLPHGGARVPCLRSRRRCARRSRGEPPHHSGGLRSLVERQRDEGCQDAGPQSGDRPHAPAGPRTAQEGRRPQSGEQEPRRAGPWRRLARRGRGGAPRSSFRRCRSVADAGGVA